MFIIKTSKSLYIGEQNVIKPATCRPDCCLSKPEKKKYNENAGDKKPSSSRHTVYHPSSGPYPRRYNIVYKRRPCTCRSCVAACVFISSPRVSRARPRSRPSAIIISLERCRSQKRSLKKRKKNGKGKMLIALMRRPLDDDDEQHPKSQIKTS